MTKAPLVSVIVPLFNQERFVRQAIESALAQGLADLEVIVVDDGSTDASAAIVQEFISRPDHRVRLIRQANSGGPSRPRNVGIEHSTGKFIAFLDPDDYWYPGTLALQLDVLARYDDVAMVFADSHLVDVSEKILGSYLSRIDYFRRALPHLREMADGVYLSEPSFFAFSSAEAAGPLTLNVLLRREALFAETSWFPTDLQVGEDLDLWFRIIQKHRSAFINRQLSAYRLHSASLTHQADLRRAGQIGCHERNFVRSKTSLSSQQLQRYLARIAGLHADVGYAAWRRGDNKAARAAYRRAWRWSKKFEYVLAWFKACLPAWITSRFRTYLRIVDDGQ